VPNPIIGGEEQISIPRRIGRIIGFGQRQIREARAARQRARLRRRGLR
jgi:hypothetical protein